MVAFTIVEIRIIQILNFITFSQNICPVINKCSLSEWPQPHFHFLPTRA